MRKLNLISTAGFALLSLILLIGFQQCTLIKGLSSIYAERVDTCSFTNEHKEVLFVGMHHFGKKAFYRNVQDVVKGAKEDGYVLFYESMGLNKADTILQLKVRKAMGFVPSREGYQKFTERFDKEKFTVQDDRMFLGIKNGLDINADINPETLVRKLEETLGEIPLTPSDWDTPLYQSIDSPYSNVDLAPILIDFRNKHLAKEITDSSHKKIIILYGANHRKGVLEHLKHFDPKWRTI